MVEGWAKSLGACASEYERHVKGGNRPIELHWIDTVSITHTRTHKHRLGGKKEMPISFVSTQTQSLAQVAHTLLHAQLQGRLHWDVEANGACWLASNKHGPGSISTDKLSCYLATPIVWPYTHTRAHWLFADNRSTECDPIPRNAYVCVYARLCAFDHQLTKPREYFSANVKH